MTEYMNIFIVLLFLVYNTQAKWSYTGETGPQYWPTLFHGCGGQSQSAAQLRSSDAIEAYYDSFVFVNYDFLPSKCTLYNNGYAAVLKMTHPSNVPSIVRGGGLPGEYVFLQGVFHWGEHSKIGSEHHLDDRQYPMELHLVHYKREYGSVQEAIQKPDGIAILAILFKTSLLDNPALTHMTDALGKVRKHGKDCDFYSSTSLIDLLPHDRNSYFRYSGSLTTPLCEEIVVWTVFTQPIEISEKQLGMFRKLEDKDGRPLANNFRPIQKLNDRKIYINKVPKRYTLRCELPIVCPLIGNIASFFGYL